METPDIQSLIEKLHDTTLSPYQRSRVFEDFLKHPEHTTHLSVVDDLLEDENRSLRSDVVRALSRETAEPYQPYLAHALDDSDDYIKREALRGLATCTDGEIIQKIETLVETEAYSLKAEAERALKSIQDNLPAEPEEIVEPGEKDEEDAEEGTPSEVPEVEPIPDVPEVEPFPEASEVEKGSTSGQAVEDHPTVGEELAELSEEPPPICEEAPAPPPVPPVDAVGPVGKKPPPVPDQPPPKPPTLPPEPPVEPKHSDTIHKQRSDRKRVKREKSSCGPVACGCLILVAVLLLIGALLMFVLVENKSTRSRTDIAPEVIHSY